jgi:hypothetical protein
MYGISMVSASAVDPWASNGTTVIASPSTQSKAAVSNRTAQFFTLLSLAELVGRVAASVSPAIPSYYEFAIRG